MVPAGELETSRRLLCSEYDCLVHLKPIQNNIEEKNNNPKTQK